MKLGTCLETTVVSTHHLNMPRPILRGAPIHPTLVADEDRLSALRAHFGRGTTTVQHCIYSLMGVIAPEFRGCYWHFYELSNGGFYMAPDLGSVRISVPEHRFEAVVSADAAGVIVCLMTFRHVAAAGCDRGYEALYEALHSFASTRPDWDLVLQAAGRAGP